MPDSWMKSLFLVLLLLFLPGTASAQSRELWISMGESSFGFPYFHSNRDLGTSDPAGQRSDVQIGNGFRLGFRVAYNSPESFGHEFQYAYNRSNFIDNTGAILGHQGSSEMVIHQAGYNFMYYFTSSERDVRPFATAGIHFSNFGLPKDVSTPHYSSYKLGFNYGLGLKYRITNLFGLRADVRAYETHKPKWGGLLTSPGGLQHQAEASAGLGFYF